MDPKSLKDITIDRLSQLINEDILDELVKNRMRNMNLPWITKVGNIFDATTIHYCYHEWMPELYVEYLYEFCETFPQFVNKVVFDKDKFDNITIKETLNLDDNCNNYDGLSALDMFKHHLPDRKCFFSVYSKGRGYFKRNDEYYCIYTGDNRDPIVNDDMINFFKKRGMCYSRGVDRSDDDDIRTNRNNENIMPRHEMNEYDYDNLHFRGIDIVPIDNVKYNIIFDPEIVARFPEEIDTENYNPW